MSLFSFQSPTHKGNFLQGGKQTVSNNINHQQNANHRRNNSCSPPLNKSNNNSSKEEFSSKSSGQESPRKLERSSSESSAINSRGQTNSSRYKTELCRPFEESGVCKYGDKCQFAHGIKELRSMARHPKYKTELCRTFHSTGLCPYGPRCHFIHNSEQNKKILLNNLTGQPTSNRPKALSSIGSAGDVSPASSNGGTPTGTKSFDDMFQMSPASPGNVFFPQDNLVNNFQRYSSGDYPIYDYKTDIYDSINVFNDKLVSVSSLDNFSFQSGPVLELCPSAPLTPATPLDSNHLIFRLPIFDGFQNGK